MKKISLITSYIMACFIASSQTIINVPIDYPTIQAGIDTANPGDTVLVQTGTYFETINFKGKKITVASLFLISQDTSYISQTIIDANKRGAVATFNSGEDTCAILAGFTLQNGNGSDETYFWSSGGGGVFCHNSSPTIKHNRISNNSASLGGGIFCMNSAPRLYSLNITKNQCTIEDYWEGNSGGGIYCYNSSPLIKNVIVNKNLVNSFNLTHQGGGIHIASDSHPVMINCTLSNNSSTGLPGGGIYCYESKLTMSNICINGNTGGVGAGIFALDSEIFMEEGSVISNSSGVVFVGGLGQGGGIYCKESEIIMTGGSIIGNAAQSHGGGIYCHNSTCYLDGVIISGNRTLTSGGGIYFDVGADIHFNNNNRCSIFNNHACIFGKDIFVKGTQIHEIILDTFTVISPSSYFACPLDNFNFDILNSYVDAINQDLYVSETGSDYNSGLSADDPLKTINFALMKILADSNNPTIIYLAPGAYSPENTGETLPLNMKDYVSLSGSAKETTILNGDSLYGIIYCYEDDGFDITGITLDKSVSQGVYCFNSSITLNDVIIMGCVSQGIYCEQSNPYISNLEILHNGYGGIRLVDSDPIIENTLIRDNYNTAIVCHESNPILNMVVMKENSGSVGGLHCSNSSPKLNNVIISGNQSSTHDGYGGGVSISNGSHPDFNNVLISGNTAQNNGGGVYISNSKPAFNKVTIKENNAFKGGGIYLDDESDVVFNQEAHCNIYLNHANKGKDLFSNNDEQSVLIVVDTFSVLNPTEFYAWPLNKFSFDIHHGMVTQADFDVFVSPQGSNMNSGANFDEALKNLDYAFSILAVDSVHPRTINLAPGIYSSSTNEIFPICPINHVQIKGAGMEQTILDANKTGSVIYLENNQDVTISDLTIQGGLIDDDYGLREGAGIFSCNSSGDLKNLVVKNNCINIRYTSRGAGICCDNSNLILDSVYITDNTLISGSYSRGGGMAVYGDIFPVLNNVFIERNKNFAQYEAWGGGLAVRSSGEEDNFIMLNNVTVNDNFIQSDQYGGKGGGICFDNASLIFNNGEVCGNYSNNSGGVIVYKENYSGQGNLKINISNVIINNNFGEYVGGISVSSLGMSSFLENVKIENNYGGGLSCRHSDLSLTNVLIDNNHAGSMGSYYPYIKAGGIECKIFGPEDSEL